LPELEALAESIDKELRETGFPNEKRPFRPHLTLARIKWIRDKKLFYDLVSSYKSKEIQPVVTDRVVLFESILQPQGPLYIPLRTYVLQS
jgi:2'-5' RNA ligase